MSDQEVLTKAIQKAMANGWSHPHTNDSALRRNGAEIMLNWGIQQLFYKPPHDFAKALWQERIEHGGGMWTRPENAWQYHLQQMVVADDPIKYLGEHI